MQERKYSKVPVIGEKTPDGILWVVQAQAPTKELIEEDSIKHNYEYFCDHGYRASNFTGKRYDRMFGNKVN